MKILSGNGIVFHTTQFSFINLTFSVSVIELSSLLFLVKRAFLKIN